MPRVLSRCGLALLSILSACTRDADGLDDFRAALASSSGVAPRLSVAREFRPCIESLSSTGTITVAACPAAGRKLTRFPPVRGTPGDPRAHHLLAIIDLVTADPRGKALDRSITSLRRTAELTGYSAPVLADLAAALIVRAERIQAPRDLLEAYELADRAVERDPRQPAALYNRALAIDRFGLVDEAVVGWQSFLAVDSTSGWAVEARRRIRLARAVSAPTRPPANAPLSAFQAYAAVEPQGARELGMDQLLAQWGEAVEAGDAARANDALRRAEVLGTALERRPGGDHSLADAVRVIRSAAEDRATTRVLSRAHREYGAAMSLYDSAAYDRAGAMLEVVVASAGTSPVLRDWARVYKSTVFAHLHAPRRGVPVLDERVRSIDPHRYPALAARAMWSLANTMNRAEVWERGLRIAQRSSGLFSGAGERENEGAVLAVATDARFVLGEPDSGYAATHRALDRLRTHRASLRLHNLLASTADKAALDGLPRAAVRIEDEDVRVGTRHSPMYAAEALLRRARLRASRGDLGAARNDVEMARPLVATVDVPFIRKWLQADLHEAEATSAFYDDPERQIVAFDSAAAFFAPLPFRLLPELVGAARASLAKGDAADAANRLVRAMRLLEQRRDSIGMEPRRAAVFDAAQSIVDRLVMLSLAEGHVSDALRTMDGARASLAPAGHLSAGNADIDLRSRPGEALVEYAVVADTLVIWTLNDGTVDVARTTVETRHLAQTMESAETKLERGASESELRPELSQLYEWLIRPVEARLGGVETPMALIVEGSLAGVPFAALFDRRRSRYLIEDHPLRFVVSIRDAQRPSPVGPLQRALFVADPAFDPRENPLLDRLRAGRSEVRQVVASYPEAEVLEGPDATASTLMANLSGAGLIHFAGHAVFDDARPERSYLVLAPGGGNLSGRVTATDLARLDLRDVRLVVLSACKTVRGGRGRASGYTGLSGALLAAGAGGTIGSTWEVEDHATAALMATFHHRYTRSRDGPGSLRAAQLEMLRSGRSWSRTPGAWAAFRYAGR